LKIPRGFELFHPIHQQRKEINRFRFAALVAEKQKEYWGNNMEGRNFVKLFLSGLENFIFSLKPKGCGA
jgi:hypothetical protein